MPTTHPVIVEVGGVAVRLETEDERLIEVLERRFGRFLNPSAEPLFQFDITLVPDGTFDADADLQVGGRQGHWIMQRGDFHAEWNVAERRGRIRQTLNPYAIDSVLRIVHTLVLATDGGFLLHAASAVRNGRAYLFTGPSGAGKSTIVGLAPADVTVLTDEISVLEARGRRIRRIRNAVRRRAQRARGARERTRGGVVPSRPRIGYTARSPRRIRDGADADAQYPLLRR